MARVVAMVRAVERVNSVKAICELAYFAGCFDSILFTRDWSWVLQESAIRLTELEDTLCAVGEGRWVMVLFLKE